MTADDFWAYESDADALSDAEQLDLSELDDLDALDGFEDLDELDAFESEEDALDSLSDLADDDGLDDAFDLMDEDLGLDDLDDLEADDLDDFAQRPGSALYLPRAPSLVTGPAALAAARQLNPLVLASLRGDDADALVRRLRNVARRAARRFGVGRILGRVRRVAGGLARRVGRVALRALPAIQRIARLAGPWGTALSAVIGGVRGLASGGGLRGALAGAVGGIVPGFAGRLVSRVLRGNGADHDAAMDALADMADAGQAPAAVALPVASALAASTVAGQGLQRAGVLAPRTALVLPATRAAERIFLASAGALPGSAGQRVRLMRLAARTAALRLGQQGSPARTARAMPTATRQAVQRVIQTARRAPQLGLSTRMAALRRLLLRQRLIRRWMRQMGIPQLGAARLDT